MQIQSIVICNTRLLCESIQSLIADHPVLRLVGMAKSCTDALSLMRNCQAEVVLLETASTESLQDLRALTSRVPRIKVVAFGVPDVENVILDYAEAGVIGFVTQDATLQETVAIVQAAVRDELKCSQRTAAALLRRVRVLANNCDDGDSMSSLTPRETNLLNLIEQGMSNKDIARTLKIELSTVKNHVHNILEKLNVRRRGEAAALMHRSLGRTKGRLSNVQTRSQSARFSRQQEIVRSCPMD